MKGIINAIWIQKMSDYRKGERAVLLTRDIIDMKVRRREILMGKYHIKISMESQPTKYIQQVLLYEARAAKVFWGKFSQLLPYWCRFPGRKPRAKDITNALLDIGYHHLNYVVKNILDKYAIYPGLGIFHVAHLSNSTPLVYDLMEMFRADVVEAEVLSFLRLKKKSLKKLSQKDIAYFISKINQRLDKTYFLKDFKQCQTYRYYIELQILKFIKAVNHNQALSLIYLPNRHENRCSIDKEKNSML